MPKGKYLDDSNYFVGVMPNGELRFFCEERDYLEAYADAKGEEPEAMTS